MDHVSMLTVNLSGYDDSVDNDQRVIKESSQRAISISSSIKHKIAQMEDAKESIVDCDQKFTLKYSSFDTVYSETGSSSASSEESLCGDGSPSECHTSCHCRACCRCRHLSGQEYDKTCSRDVKGDPFDLANDWHISSPKYTCLGNFYSPSPNNKIKCRRKDVFEYLEDSSPDVTRGVNSVKSSSQTLQNMHLAYSSLTDKGDIDTTLNSDASETCHTGHYPYGISPIAFKQKLKAMGSWFKEFNDEQRNIALTNLLENCDLPQMHLLSVKMESNLHNGCPPNCQDIITWLPRNLTTKIMTMLDPVSLSRASMACREWSQIAEDPAYWKVFCCQSQWRMSKPAELKQTMRHMSREGRVQWKKVFAERFRLRNNWLKGRCTVRTFEGHSQGISCVQFDDSRIVSGSSDKTIKVWNIRTNAPWSVQTLVGHSGTVRCLHLDGNRLVSGSSDRTIKVWDLSSQESWSSIACKVTMIGHSDTVRCLQVDDDKVISGSYDKTLKVWDIRTGQCRRTLRLNMKTIEHQLRSPTVILPHNNEVVGGHQEAVLCVHFSDTKIVSGSCDKTIKVWSFDGDCVRTLEGHHDAVTCLQFDSTRIISGSLDCNLKIWDMVSGKCVNTIDWKAAEGHTGVVRYLQADSWRLVSAADDKTIKVWNLETGQRLVTLRNHTDGVTCLQFNDYFIVSGSYDKTVKLWDFSSC